ncbi:hypothetical protein HanOQP8_Chr12g0453871 [Helianthus annuus]|nr:hypothetical protein HanOQP8_Chr12g0453871 [Helianthus annuus]
MVWVGLWVVTGFGSHIKHGFFPCTNPNFDIHFSGRLTPNLNEDINLSSSRTLIASTIIEHEHNLVCQRLFRSSFNGFCVTRVDLWFMSD